MQFRRKAPWLLGPQQPEAGNVLVDLGLQFQLQQAHGPVVGGIPGQIDEVTDTLQCRPGIGQVRSVE